jgi:DNA-binding CsgD family transcriptional regulator
MGHRRTTTDEADEGIHTIEPAVEQLIRRLVEDDVRPDPADEADEVILDIAVGGVRYLVVRCATRVGPTPDGARGPTPVGMRSDRGPALSPREYEIARMVAKGHANKTIASLLDISSWTVSSHLRRIFSKLDVTSRAAMVARLLDDGPSRESPAPSFSDQSPAWPTRTASVPPPAEAQAPPTRDAPDLGVSRRPRRHEHDGPPQAFAGTGPRPSHDISGRIPSTTS